MKVKIKKSDYSMISVGMEGEAKKMDVPNNTQWYEVTFQDIPSPVPGSIEKGEFVGAFQEDQLEFLEDDKTEYQSIAFEDAQYLNLFSGIINNWATKKGWNDKPDDLTHKCEQIALMHSELSECLEYLRKKKQPAMDDKVPSLTGEAAELADCLIRIFHYCGKRGINLGEAVRLKHEYNITRPYRHGKLN